MKRLPDRPNLDNLKKQAKDLLSLYRRADPGALARIRGGLPAAAMQNDQQIAALDLRLHDAQSCLAREYGFPSWAELKSFVVARGAVSSDRNQLGLNWLRLVYAGDISGTMNRSSPAAALRLLEEHAEIIGNDPYLACAIGDETALRSMTAQDAAWLDRPGGPLNLPPLVAVTHSSMIQLPQFRDRLLTSAKLLLDAGANPNQSVGSRWTPGSLSQPDDKNPLSALYGAAGQNHDPDMTKLLLDAGADPNDGESLYHSLDRPVCTRVLLEAGARVTGSNAMYRVLDLDSFEALEMLLASGGPPIGARRCSGRSAAGDRRRTSRRYSTPAQTRMRVRRMGRAPARSHCNSDSGRSPDSWSGREGAGCFHSASASLPRVRLPMRPPRAECCSNGPT
jgi:hypothetical protein